MYIIIIDLDGTIVGDVRYQVAKYCVTKALGLRIKQVNASFDPVQKLVRPGFVQFVQQIKAYFNGKNEQVYFYVYTASERQWALAEVSWIEQHIGFKFNRPIFTRDQCTMGKTNEFVKSLNKIVPRIWTSIATLTKTQVKLDERKDVLANRILIIDNNPVFIDNRDKLLLCSDYNYAIFEDILDAVPNQYLLDESVIKSCVDGSINDMSILLTTSEKTMSGQVDINVPLFHSKKYKMYAKKCMQIYKNNKKYEKDRFWKNLRKVIIGHSLTDFSPATVKNLNNCGLCPHQKLTMLKTKVKVKGYPKVKVKGKGKKLAK